MKKGEKGEKGEVEGNKWLTREYAPQRAATTFHECALPLEAFKSPILSIKLINYITQRLIEYLINQLIT